MLTRVWPALALGFAFFGSSSAVADRLVLVPPVVLQSVHGGLQPNGAGGYKTCAEASMAGASTYNNDVRAPTWAVQAVTVVIQNIMPAGGPPAIVEVHYLATTSVSSRNSNGAADTWAKTPGPGHTLGDRKVLELRIDPGTVASAVLSQKCGQTSCQSVFSCTAAPGCTTPIPINGPDWASNCAGGGNNTLQVCIYQESKVNIEIHAKGDRGALVGALRTGAHRCSGLKDLELTGLPNFAINGGRPF